MNKNLVYDNKLKGINERLIPDGVFMISPKIDVDKVLTNHKNKVSFCSLTKEIHQFFYIKYNDKYDYYTITSIIHHCSLGVKKNESNYEISYISNQDDHSIQWKITRDKEYFLKNKETAYYLQYNPEEKDLFLAKKNNRDGQMFLIYPVEIIENGFYSIKSILPNNLYITYSNNDEKQKLFLSKYQKENQLYYIVFDENDGCYSIINMNNQKCFSPDKNPKVTSKIIQSDFYNLDYQKWIIGTNNNQNYFLIPKSNVEKEPLILCNYKNNKFDLFFKSSYQTDNTLNICFQFQAKLPSNNFDQILAKIKSRLKFRYEKEIVFDHKISSEREINDFFFENNFFVRNLVLPIDINRISQNAFINCFRIKCIECHPKWLQLLPNKINVENIVVTDGVESAKENSFLGFYNLKYLKIPKSLKFKNCSSDLFKDIYGLRKFEGNLKFLQIIQKDSLSVIHIPSYVKKIPEGICADCKNLSEIEIDKNSSLKYIGPRAFAGCILLSSFPTPESVEDISPDAFDKCNKHFDYDSLIRNEKQRISYQKELVIEPEVTEITEKYKEYVNITSINIHLNVQKCNSDVLKSFKNLKLVKCDPKWLNDFDTLKIESVSIPNKISEIKKKDFEQLIHLKHFVIPESVNDIEEGTFNNCRELTSIQCCPNHLKFLNQAQIKSIIIGECSQAINKTDFKGFVNLEYCKIPENLTEINLNAFSDCKKLMKIDHPLSKKLINNASHIDKFRKEIFRKEFEGWTNLQTLKIPQSVTKIEEGTFKDCINIKYLKCDPKWFPYIPKYTIKRVYIPNFVKEIKYGDFEGFYSMYYINLPENISIKDNFIFESCQNLKKIESKSPILSKLSDITLERCENITNAKYENPIFNIQPDPNKIHDETNLAKFRGSESYLMNSQTNSFFMSKSIEESNVSEDELENLSADGIIEFDKTAKKYWQHIIDIHDAMESNDTINDFEPNDTKLSTISKVCSYVCHVIFHNKDDQNLCVPNNVQIYAILRLADEILNNDDNENSKGSIAEIKAGEGKSLVITMLSIILVKFGHKIDIVEPHIEFAKLEKANQSVYFELFDIKTAAFYDTENDEDQLTKSVINLKCQYFEYFKGYEQSEFSRFNMDAFESPVVYSSCRNFEFYYLHTLLDLNPIKHDFDIVLINEIDSMLIDELDSPAVISRKVDFGFSQNIYKTVYDMCSNQNTDVQAIINDLKTKFPMENNFDVQYIELLKNAANEAMEKIEGIDYFIEKNKIIVIDRDTGFKMPNSHWPNYVYEMVEIKNEMFSGSQQITICQITQQTYFSRYKKIAAVADTIGTENDEQILKEGYNVKTFKVPLNMPIKTDVYYKNRPDEIEDIFEMIYEEIYDESSYGRPVLVVFDNESNAQNFLKKYKFKKINLIYGKTLLDDEEIEKAGIEGAITIVNSAAVKRVNIELTKESKENGGLHIIIPMKMPTIRSLEQAVGAAGKHGDPGSVSIYISKKDLYNNTPKFNNKNANLDDIQMKFAKFIKDHFQWILYQREKRKANNNIIFPFAASYSDILNIMSRHIFLVFKDRELDDNIIINKFRSLACKMVLTAWGVFFSNLQNDIYNNNSHIYCQQEYNRFIAELKKFFSPEKCSNIENTCEFIKKMYINDKNKDHLIYKRFNISYLGVDPPDTLFDYNDKDNDDDNYNDNDSLILTDEQPNTKNSSFFSKCKKGVGFLFKKSTSLLKQITANINSIPNEEIHKKSENVDIKAPSIKFIKRAMTLANEAYSDDGKFSFGRVIFSSTKNEIFKPVFYVIEYKNKLYIAIRGSSSDNDWHTDFNCNEILKNFNGFYIYFHYGFLNAAEYVLSYVKDFILTRDYKKIYFIGHSYAAAVSNVLCLLTKTNAKYKDKNIFSMAFAPPPSMSKIPAEIQSCIFQFINKADIVPYMSVNNVKNTINVDKINIEKFIDTNIRNFKCFPNKDAQNLAVSLQKFKNDIVNIFKTAKTELHVTGNIGNIYLIGFKDTTKLFKCQVDQNDLNKRLYFTLDIFVDHGMVEYIKAFSVITEYNNYE